MRAWTAVRKAIGGLLSALALASTAGAIPANSDKTQSSLRWEEGQPGCTLSRDDDGKYRFGFWTADFGIILAVDSQELEKVRRRVQPIFALHVTARYRGSDSLDVAPGEITLEFVKHSHDAHHPLDPDALAGMQRKDADAHVVETEREIQKHPENRVEKEALLATRQKDAAEMIEFLHTRSLRAARLDRGHPEVSGWVLFSTKSKWMSGLDRQEEFLLRVPSAGRVVELPFSLPASEGDLILRRRPEN
jgi:hypothetical protein